MHQTLMMSAGGVALDFPAWLRITHFINFLMIGLLIRSGWEVIASHPRFYWNNHCTPGSEWLKFTKDKVSTVTGIITAPRAPNGSVLQKTRFRPSLANTPPATINEASPL